MTNYLGTPADFTILVLVVLIGVVLWFVWERVGQMHRDMDALKRKLGVYDPPEGPQGG